MKFKFKAESKDWKFFGIFAIILLYFVAIFVLNLSQFAMGDPDRPFYGFNPIKAFTPAYFGTTLVVYIIALGACIFSVQDRIFDREKGFGFVVGKKESSDGYARWAEEKEFKKFLKRVDLKDTTADAGGIPLINNGKEMWVDDSEGHNLIVGSTGAGKTQIAILPLVKSLAMHDESMIITDPKGEIYDKTSDTLRKRGYNVVLLNFRDPQKGSGWNPLNLPYEYYKNGNKDKANELVDDLAVNILYEQNGQASDPFWEKTSADYFSGLTLGLFEDAKEEEINLNSINLLTNVGEEKCGRTTYINEYFNAKEPTSPAYVSASSTLIAPNDTKTSILAVFKQKIRLFASRENISEMLSHSDFDMKDIGRKKTAVFIIIQDEKKTYHSLVTIFIKQCYETLVDVAQANGGKLPFRTNFLLDEFANMPPLKDVETMVSAARSRKMRFFFVIQNFAQLSDVYGKEKGDTIRGNCTNTIYLISSELAALEEISKMCGEVKSKEKDKTASTPLITVSDLQRLPEREIIVLRTRKYPFKVKLKYDWEINWNEDFISKERGTYLNRKKEPIHVFDLKGFVNKRKEDRINKLMGTITSKKEEQPKPKKLGNIDDLVKRIDAKIAELEKEEEKEAIKTVKKSTTSKDKKVIVNIPASNTKKTDTVSKKEAVKEEYKKEILKNKKTIKDKITKKEPKKSTAKVTKKENYVTDDQFFDDFFRDDE